MRSRLTTPSPLHQALERALDSLDRGAPSAAPTLAPAADVGRIGADLLHLSSVAAMIHHATMAQAMARASEPPARGSAA